LLYVPRAVGRFDPTGPVDVPGLQHSVATLSWGVLTGALGPSDGSAGASSNVPSALGVIRHAVIYSAVPSEIEEAFGVLEQHVILGDQLYPVALATLPFLFDTTRRGSPVGGRIAMLIARYAAAASSLEKPLAQRFTTIVADHAGEIVRWFGRSSSYDLAVGALAIHVPALREMFIAAVEGAERVSPETLLALLELHEAPGESAALALAMLDGPDATDMARTCAAAFLAQQGTQPADVLSRIDAALSPSAPGALKRHTRGLWTPKISRPKVAPKLFDAEVVFTGKKLVVVRAGTRSVTLPWAGAELSKGDRLQVGLTSHGEPKLAVLTDWNGNVRVIDFDVGASEQAG
jgi:hypothetical protein